MSQAGKRQKKLAALAVETRRLAKRKRKILSPSAQAELAALVAAGREALGSQDPARIDSALRGLEEAFVRYLEVHRKSAVRMVAEAVVVAVLLGLLTRYALLETFRIPSGSMAPTLLPGDVILVSKFSYGLRLPLLAEPVLQGAPPRRGDAILYEEEEGSGRSIVQRVAGIPGDTIEIVDQVLFLNGEAQPRKVLLDRFEYWSYRDDLDYWHPQSGSVWEENLDGRRHAVLHSRLLPSPRPSEGPFLVPDGHVFLLGDNRDEAADGRLMGGWYLPMERIRGKVWLVGLSWGPGGAWPWGDEGLRLERLLRPLDTILPRDR